VSLRPHIDRLLRTSWFDITCILLSTSKSNCIRIILGLCHTEDLVSLMPHIDRLLRISWFDITCILLSRWLSHHNFSVVLPMLGLKTTNRQFSFYFWCFSSLDLSTVQVNFAWKINLIYTVVCTHLTWALAIIWLLLISLMSNLCEFVFFEASHCCCFIQINVLIEWLIDKPLALIQSCIIIF